MTDRRRRFLTTTVPILGMLLMLVACVVHCEASYAWKKFPDGFATAVDFFDRFTVSTGTNVILALFRYDDDGEQYVELSGPLPSKWPLATPSGPPAYLFDDSGRFVDWCSDPGDNPSWRRKWPLADGRPLSDEGVQRRFADLLFSQKVSEQCRAHGDRQMAFLYINIKPAVSVTAGVLLHEYTPYKHE